MSQAGATSSNTKGVRREKQSRNNWGVVAAVTSNVGLAAQKIWKDGSLVRRPREAIQSLQADQFNYSPLPLSSSIRLLKIEPANATQVISCAIRSVDLDKSPKFTALSYSWIEDKSWSARGRDKALGKLSGWFVQAQMQWKVPGLRNAFKNEESRAVAATETIFCNGTAVRVHASLYGALLQLRKRRADEEYWIDAVCMNQADDQEKTQQVQMMGRIYNSAQLVLVWLGPSPTFLDPGFAHLDWFIDNTLSKWTETASDNEPAPSKSKEEELLTDPDFLAFLALIHIISRRYFRRTWVLQETGLAQKVVFLLGENYFGPEKLSKYIASASGPLLDRPSTLPYYHPGLKAIVSPWIERVEKLPIAGPAGHNTFGRNGDWSIHQWLMMCAERKAGDPRDVVFAGLSMVRPELLSIRQDLQFSEASPPPPLPPRPAMLLESELKDASSSDSTPSSLPPSSVALIVDQASRDSSMEPGPPPLPPRPDLSLTSKPSDDSLLREHSASHNILWPKLRVDYTASIGQVALNLAACLLSGQDGDTILSISSQFQARNGSLGEYSPTAPSWIPPLTRRKGMFSQRRQNLGDPNSTFSAATQLRNDPMISADGSTLYLDGALLGRIEKRIDPPNHIPLSMHTDDKNSEGPDGLLRLIRTINSLPRNYRGTDRSTLAAVADVCTLGVLRYDPLGFQNITQGFCFYLHDKIIEARKRKNKGSDTKGSKIDTEAMKESQTKMEIRYQEQLENEKKELPEAYRGLREAYPEMKWLGPNTKLSKKEERLRSFFSAHSALGTVLSPWRMFTTDTGYVGLGPMEIRQGDQAVLIKGANVPYLFRHVDAALGWEIETFRNALFILEQKNSLDDAEEVRQKIRDLEALIGTKDGWVLVGEAYVEGVMDGEAVSIYADHFERLCIV